MKILPIKKIFLIILAMSITSLTLISCKNGTDNQINTNNSDSISDTDANNIENTTVKPEFEPEQNTDYDGYKFRIFGYGPDSGGYWLGLYCNEIAAEEEIGDPINDAVYKRTREVENLYNIQITPVMIDPNTRNDIGSLALRYIKAGEDTFDFALINGNSLPVLISSVDALTELTGIDNLDLTKSWWNRNSIESLSIGNKLYTALSDISLYSFMAAQGMIVNKNLIQEYNLENPYDLVRSGKWTWDKLNEMCKAVVKDLNGDGIINGYDQIGLMSEPQSLRDAVISAGIKLVSKDKYDMPLITLMSERSVMAVDKIFSVLNEEDFNIVWTKTKGVTNSVEATDKFNRGEVLFFHNQLNIALESRAMENDFAILPTPKIDEIQDKYYSTPSMSYTDFVCIPTTCTDVDRTVNVIQALGYYSQKYVRPAFYEYTVTYKAVRDEDSLEMLDIILDGLMYDLGYAFNWNGINDIFNSMMSSRKNTFASNYEKALPKIETSMNKMLENMGLK